MEDVCLVKIGRSDHKFEWLVGSVYMNCEGVRKGHSYLRTCKRDNGRHL